MPKCINDPKKSYKGTEPSPKGLGYCAHSEEIGSERKGRDGNLWVVKKVGKSKRWMKVSTKKSIKLFYKKKLGGSFIHGYGNEHIIKIGKVIVDKFYKWESYNKFSKVGEKIPKWENIDVPKGVCEEFIEGKNGKKIKELLSLNKKKHYFTLDNGGRPFCVYIIGKKVIVYKETKNSDYIVKGRDKDNEFMWRWFHYLDLPENIIYTEKIKTFTTKKIYIGKSPKNEMTKYSGGYGKKWDGNTILLELTGNKYVYLGETVTEFTLQKGDKVEEYWSPVGNSAVPYSFILGEKNVYFMWDMMYISRDILFQGVDMEKVEWTDLSSVYYGAKKDKLAKGIKTKVLEKRKF